MEYYRTDCGAPVRAPVGSPLECHEADFAAFVVVVGGAVATANLAVAPTDVPVGNLTDNLDLVGAPAETALVWASLAAAACLPTVQHHIPPAA